MFTLTDVKQPLKEIARTEAVRLSLGDWSISEFYKAQNLKVESPSFWSMKDCEGCTAQHIIVIMQAFLTDHHNGLVGKGKALHSAFSS